MLIEGRELLADLVLLDVMDFDVILEMDWLSQHYAMVDCQRKEVIFRILNDEEFKFVGNKSSAPQNLISAIIAGKMLRKGCQGYLVLLDVMDFDVILGMNWLSQHYAMVDYQSKKVIFKISNDEEFKFVGDKSLAPQNLIFAITAKKILRKGC